MEEQTGTNRGTPSIVDFMQELGVQDKKTTKNGRHIDRHARWYQLVQVYSTVVTVPRSYAFLHKNR